MYMSLVDTTGVYVVKSSLCGKDESFLGVFSNRSFKKGEVVEKGIMRRLENFDGQKNAYVFTWSDDIPNTTWAIGSGCSTFYNTAHEDNANVIMNRYYENDSFEIIAKQDMEKDTELLHTYKSLKWREVFEPIHAVLYEKKIE